MMSCKMKVLGPEKKIKILNYQLQSLIVTIKALKGI